MPLTRADRACRSALVRMVYGRFLPEILATCEPLERFVDLLGVPGDLLPEILAAGESLERFVDLLGFVERTAREFLEEVHLHLLRGIEDLRQLLGDLLLRRCDVIGVEERAGADIVSRRIAVRASHG